jgi:hypothetical protein
MQYLKHNAAATIMLGPFVDKTDGVTLKTDATTITDIDHATTGIFLSKAGGAAEVRHQNVTASVADAYGMMKVTLDTTDTNTIGMLDVLFAKAATYLPVHKQFMVLPASVYDAWVEHPVHDFSGMNFDDRLPVPSFDTMAPGDLMANVYRWDGGRVSIPTTEGVPDANVMNWKGATAPAMTGDAFARLGSPAGASVSADVAAVKVDTAAILVDTGTTLDGKIDTIAVDVAGLDGAAMRGTDNAALASVCTEGRLAELDAANLPTDVAARATPAQVNAEVLDVLNVDTFAEPGQGAPAATTTLAAKINYLFKFLRNKVTQDATTLKVYDDAGTTVDQKATVSDDATTFTRGEIGSGP